MFGMGFSEILIILIIGIIFLGPEKLPVAMVKIAKLFNALKKTVNEAKDSIDQELKIQELKSEAMEYKKKLEESTNSVKSSLYVDEFEKIKNSGNEIADVLNNGIKDAMEPIKESEDKKAENTEKVKLEEKKEEKNV